MKLSARNVLKGRVVALTPGAVNVEVVLEIAPGVQVVSIITKSSAESLGLAVGKEAYAGGKAWSVMVAVDWRSRNAILPNRATPLADP